jgi:hypothetical protein
MISWHCGESLRRLLALKIRSPVFSSNRFVALLTFATDIPRNFAALVIDE